MRAAKLGCDIDEEATIHGCGGDNGAAKNGRDWDNGGGHAKLQL